MILFLSIIPVFIIGLVFKKKGKVTGKVLLTFSTVLLWFYGTLFGMLALVMSTPRQIYVPLFAVLSTLIAVLILVWIWKKSKSKKIYIPFVSLLAVCILTIGVFAGMDIYKYSIPTISDSSIGNYYPYAENTKVAVLEKEATLKLKDDLPRMDGATAIYPVYSAFARAVYPKEKLDGYNAFDVLDCSTTTTAYEKIVDGDADIIFVAAPSEEQKAYAKEKNIELVYTPIGREAFVFFVNSKNPLDNITIEQIQGIYSGKITKWDELGVENLGDIKAFQRDEGSGSQSALQRLMKGKKLIDPPREDVISGMGEIINVTADYRNYKNAIGYSFRFYSTQMVNDSKIKLLKIDGVYPSVENIENGKYPISSEFYAVTRSNADLNTQKLLEWITGPQGQELIEKTGYVPLR